MNQKSNINMKQMMEYCYGDNHTSPITDVNTGEICCSDCGTVLIEKTIDGTSESTFAKDNYLTKARNGPPAKISVSDMSKSSIISKSNIDASGNRLRSKNIVYFSRMRFWDSRTKSSRKEHNLVRAFAILDAFASKLNMPENAKEHAAYIYRKAVEKNIIRGSSINAMMASSVLASCKQLGIPRTVDDVANVSNISKKSLSKTYRRMIKNLGLNVISLDIDYVSKVANSLSVSEKASRLANKIVSDAKKENMHLGKNPIGISAASVYLSAINYDEHVTYAEISRKTNISTVTLRKLSRLLRPIAAKYIKSIDV